MEVRGECPPVRSIQKIRLIEIFEVQRSIQIFKGVSVKQPARLVHIDLIQPWASGLLKSFVEGDRRAEKNRTDKLVATSRYEIYNMVESYLCTLTRRLDG